VESMDRLTPPGLNLCLNGSGDWQRGLLVMLILFAWNNINKEK